MKIIFQTNLHGHRAEYVHHVLDSEHLRFEKFVVWVKDCQAEELDQFKGSQRVTRVLSGPFSVEKLKDVLVDKETDSVIFLDGDNELKSVIRIAGKIPGLRTIALMMRLNPPSKIKIRPGLIWAGKFLVCFLLDRIPGVSIRQLVFLVKPKVSIFGSVRDPLPKSLKSQTPYSSPPHSGKFKIGIAGTLDPRKNIELAIQAASNLGIDYVLTLAGQVTSTYKEKLFGLIRRQDNIVVRDELLSNEDLNEEIRSSQCFLVLQNMNAPSGTLLRALSLGTPIVLGGAKTLRKAAILFPESVIWTELDPKSLSDAILKTKTMCKNPVLALPTPEDFTLDLLG